MRLLEKILFPTDFGAGSKHTEEVVANLAKTFGSEVILQHVVPGLEEDMPVPIEQAKESSWQRLNDLKADLEKQGVTVCAKIVTNGVPFAEIAHCAWERDANVIVIGSGGALENSGEQLGTTAEGVIRKATRPVWVAKRNSATRASKILCPVDYSAASARALRNAIHLARAFRAELKVLTVIRPHTRFTVYGLSENKSKHTMAKQERDFQVFLREFEFHDVSWSRLIREGKPDREILTCARQEGVDLLVMGSVGRTGITRILLGSVATKVIRDMPCSVVTVKNEDVIRLEFEAHFRDIKSTFAEGERLLASGLGAEARRHFQYCVSVNPMFAPAWEGLAEATRLLGNEEESSECSARAELIRRQLWKSQVVEAEIRLRRLKERK